MPSACLMPRPRRRNVLPDDVPAGTFSVTGPFSVGTFTSAPSAASANVTGSVSVRSLALASEDSDAAATFTRTYRSPDSPPASAGFAASARADARTVGTPAGMRTVTSRRPVGQVEAHLALGPRGGLVERERDGRLDVASARAASDVHRTRC